MPSPEGEAHNPEEIARVFLAEHDVSVDEDHTIYAERQAEKIKSGQPTWVVRNVDGPGRAYDLYVPRGIIATLLDDQGEFGSGEVELYVADPAQADRVKTEMDSVRGEYPGQNRFIELGKALELASQILDKYV
jgi:hypothetical protein